MSAPGYAPGRPVRARPVHEGVGNALRSAYDGREARRGDALPSDFQRLLAKL